MSINNLPNSLSLLRIALIPLIIIPLLLEKMRWPSIEPWHGYLSWIACLVFILASITDFVDGYLARTKKQCTKLGSFLDPIADKFLVISSLVMLLHLQRADTVAVIILILREFYITSLRLFASNARVLVPVNSLGKWKTTSQFMGITLLIGNGTPWGFPMAFYGTLCLYLAITLSLYSAVLYSTKLVKKLKNKTRKKIKKKKRFRIRGR